MKILTGLDQLVESDNDIQVFFKPTEILVVTPFDEFWIEDIDEAEALRDGLDRWVKQRRGVALDDDRK